MSRDGKRASPNTRIEFESRSIALVRTAIPLDPQLKEMVLSRLRARFAPELQAQFEVDAALLGGVQAQVGDQLIDDTIASKLAALRDALVKSAEAT